ncbi:MAG TPA: hypothetical protein VGS19_15220 [Streptosporangiaceae bacterium]|nr:hypothetical protein [Streptosporangiaceae bacterium]
MYPARHAQLGQAPPVIPPEGFRSWAPYLAAARWALPPLALAVGLYSLTTARVAAIGVYGLIQALPPGYFAALAGLGVAIVVSWRSEKPQYGQFALAVVALVILLQGAPSLIEAEPRFPPAWLHAGFTDYVAATGRVLPQVDARFSWPSFFTGMAMLARAGGLPNVIVLLKWWPAFINLLYLPPLFMLATRVLHDRRSAMLATGLFPLANWVGQDYYSPQSTAYFLYLVLLCIVLGPLRGSRPTLLPRWALPARWRKEAPPEPAPLPVAYTVTLLAILAVLCAAMDTGHQLTPFFALAIVTALAVLGRTRLAAWPVLMFLMAVGWVCYAASAYWSGHFTQLFGSLGSLGVNASNSLRLHGSPAHFRVDDVRLLIVGAIWLLAVVGFFCARRPPADRWAAAVLMVSPVVIVGGQSYGGEAGLRAFLFSLPGALCLVAVALSALARHLKAAATGLVISLLIPSFLVARWGNELSEMVQPPEIAGALALYRIAPPGSILMAITPQVFWQFTVPSVGGYKYRPNNLDEFHYGHVDEIAENLEGPNGGYVIITASQLEYAQAAYDLPTSWGTGVERDLSRSHLFRLVYRNPDTVIYKYVGSAK